jgi:hypothetical protein
MGGGERVLLLILGQLVLQRVQLGTNVAKEYGSREIQQAEEVPGGFKMGKAASGRDTRLGRVLQGGNSEETTSL